VDRAFDEPDARKPTTAQGIALLLGLAVVTLVAVVLVTPAVADPGVAQPLALPAVTMSGSPTSTPTSTPTPTAKPQPQLPRTVILGRSYQGRQIVAVRRGRPNASRVLLVIGQMHGDERGGVPIASRLRELTKLPADVAIWTITTINPDGYAQHTRQNHRGVDLNRNFTYGWSQHATGGRRYYPGRRAASELETNATIRFLRRLRPDLVVIFHQAGNGVDSSGAKNVEMSRALARGIGLPLKSFRCHGVCRGTLTSWFNHTFAGSAITVELPARVTYARNTRAVRTLAAYARTMSDF
jgi:protein MpaA